MRHGVRVMVALLFALMLAGPAAAQESPAAHATRKKLQQKITIEGKEVGFKDFLADVNGEMDKPIHFKINNGSGVSNNMKVSFKGKNVTVEKVLNDLADKYDFGWHVISNPSNNKVDGAVEVRKSKERGYEAGKEPKKSSRLAPRLPLDRALGYALRASFDKRSAAVRPKDLRL
jgi:hypothetical protein